VIEATKSRSRKPHSSVDTREHLPTLDATDRRSSRHFHPPENGIQGCTRLAVNSRARIHQHDGIVCALPHGGRRPYICSHSEVRLKLADTPSLNPFLPTPELLSLKVRLPLKSITCAESLA